ncbi:MAG: MBL fold metallo-hydrolase, partial [Candidatus Limnocylindrales bacterium]
MHVFPGGAVDPGDDDPRHRARSAIGAEDAATRVGGDLPPAAALATHVAAIRELFEEVGVLLADHLPGADLAAARARLLSAPAAFPDIVEALDLRLRTDLLVPLSRWVTPATMARRFDTRFFVAALPEGAQITLVGDEVAGQEWSGPMAALDALAAGRLGMWLPTSTTLQQLAPADSIETIRSRLAPGRLGAVEVDVLTDDVTRIAMPAGGGVAGQRINAYLVGREACILVDPGDPTGPGLERALAEAERRHGAITAVVLTHADPDHAAGAQSVAERLAVPVLAGTGAGRHLPYGPGELGDGDGIPGCDVEIRVVATPGPRPDHLAFIVGDGEVAIVGDLDGRRGARMIPAPPDRDA